MPRFVNDFHGIVWAIHEDGMEILLPRGGKILAPKTKGIRVGDAVAFLMDVRDQQVTQVMLKEEADEQVKRGSNHIFDAACRNTSLGEEDDHGEDYTEHGDVFWCPELV
jgi:hypothetical protein